MIQRMGELTASAKNEIFQSDVEALCGALRQAKDTHDVSYVIQVHEILHDMEYFLLRYAPRDIAPYTRINRFPAGITARWKYGGHGRKAGCSSCF